MGGLSITRDSVTASPIPNHQQGVGYTHTHTLWNDSHSESDLYIPQLPIVSMVEIIRGISVPLFCNTMVLIENWQQGAGMLQTWKRQGRGKANCLIELVYVVCMS